MAICVLRLFFCENARSGIFHPKVIFLSAQGEFAVTFASAQHLTRMPRPDRKESDRMG
jgi:hypothetical protein